MAIIHMHDKDGAFVAGDTQTGVTSYSYPSSANAAQATRAGAKVAEAVLSAQVRFGLYDERSYDLRNWNRLAAAGLVDDATWRKFGPSFGSRAT